MSAKFGEGFDGWVGVIGNGAVNSGIGSALKNNLVAGYGMG